METAKNKIIRGTTPTIYITAEDVADLSQYDTIKVILRQCQKEIEKNKEELTIDGGTMSFTLTQDETYLFRAGLSVAVQVRAKQGDTVSASEIVPLVVYPNLEEEVIA